jgi:lipopolysaccharide/colanic/teichoic acid biosynthesis glycosyltransferase
VAVVESYEPKTNLSSSVDPVAGVPSKRAFDLVVGVPLCVLAVPVVAVLALALLVRHRTWPFFVHERIGTAGRLVRVPKLRTLAPDHDPYADKTSVTLQPPSRLAGRLRHSHLDELPQLLLVPIGRLSLVGPRPRMVAEAAGCDDVEFDGLRTSVPQGCTGLWQISVARTARVSDHPEYDRFYLGQRTARLDGWILWRTAIQMLGARQIQLTDVPRWALRRPDVAERAVIV